MSRRTVSLLSVILIAAVTLLVGCSYDEPTRPEAPAPEPPDQPVTTKAASTTILVPDGDLTTYVGWPAHPEEVHVAWDKIDEGVANLNIYDIIYAPQAGLIEILTFTDMDTTTAVDVSELTFVIPMHASLGEALRVGFTLSYSIDGVEEGSDLFECGEILGTECGADTLLFTFSDVCYTAAEINTLQLTIESFGTWWTPDMAQILITAIDCEVGYDEVCVPEIQNLEPLRKGDNFAILWDTPCDASGAVDWGYAPDALTNTASGGYGTEHIANFSAAANEGCVYLQARSEGGTCSGVVETSAVQTSVKDVVISDVVRYFDGFDCEVDVTWTTNVKSSSVVYWGLKPNQMTNVVTGSGNTTSHSVSFDATNIPKRKRIYIKVVSATTCDSAESGTAFITRLYCIANP